MAIPGGLTPFEDFVSVSYQLISYNTLQPITHSGNYAEVNNSQFIFLKVHSLLTGFDKRINKILLTFIQYTNLNYQVYLNVSNAGHFISNTQIPLRKYTSNNHIYYEADITDIVVSSPTEEHYFAITTSSSMSFFVNGTNKPSASIVSYSVKTGNYSPYFFDRLKTYELRNYSLNVDFFSLVPFHIFNLFDYSDELVSFNLSLVNDFTHKDTSNITQTISTGLPKGFKLNIQQYIFSSGTREFTYIDENYFSHVFKECTNDNDTFTHFVDSNGSYLILEVINNGYKIYSLDGNVKTFSSSGLLLNETIKNGSNTSTISYSYTSNLLTSVSINNQSFISITYSSSSITISLPGTSSIILNFNSGSLLTSIVDQENITYQIEYDSGITGLIKSISVTNNKKLSLSFNDNLMVETVSLYTYNSSSSNYTWNVSYNFSSGSYTTSYFDDDDLVYVYHFNEEGQIIQTTCYKSNYNNVLSASCLKETIGHSFFLSTSSANYLKEITYNSNTYSHFDSSVSLFNNNQEASFLLKPKEKGQYFLYFEYLRNFINNYQSLNILSVNISITDASSNTYQIASNLTLNIDGFDKVNIFMKEIIIPTECYNQNLSLSFSLSSGDSVVLVRNIRLYRIEENNNNEYYGLNSYTGGDDLNLLNDQANPPHYYELTSFIPFEVDNLTYSINAFYQDIKATLMVNFFLNKGILFYNKGKNAYYGSVTKSGQSLNTLQLIKANYQNKRLSNDDEPYDGYKATINGCVLNNFFIESQVSYNYQFKSYSSSGKLFDQNYLLVNHISNVPYGETNESDPEHGNYKYHTYIQTLSFTYNSNGQLIKKSLSTNASNHLETYFEKASEVSSYSSDNKHLTSVNQQLFNNNNQINNIVSSYQYNSMGDVSKTTDAYNKETSYAYNKFHSLTSLTAYNSGIYHNNNISYNALLNPSSISNFNNQNQTTYSYDYKGRVSHISHDSITLDFDYQNNSNSIEYSDGNDSYSFTNTYSDYHLPINFKHDNDIILEYHYINKNSGLSGNGNPSTDQLSEIRDYKGQTGNTYKSRFYSYNDYGNMSSISENEITLGISTCLFIGGYDSDCDLNDNAIKNAFVYSRNNNAFRLENSYSFFQDPFLKHKTVREETTPYVVGITESVSTMVSGSPQLTLSTYINDLINHQIYASFNYFKDENNKLTSFIKEQAVYFGNTFKTINYGYNNNGNLNSITSSSSHFDINNSYSYNDFNELSSENSASFGQINYQYDSKGNISVISKFDSSTVYVFTYDNNNRLTSFTKTVGLNIPETFYCCGYSFGRPTLYKNKTLAWNKNELTQYDGVTFAYDGYGRRVSKSSTSLGRSVSYLYLGDALLEEVITINNVDYTLKYLHDSRSNIVGFIYNNNVYFYVKDLLNNVIAIYDQNNSLICKYLYDAYGNHKVLNPNGTENTSSTFIGNLNPIRYRSYYFDEETGLYYLKSRYYDSEICRFLSMDDISYLDSQTLNGLNLYAYCGNDPINKVDPNGQFWISLIVGLTLGAIVGFTAAAYSDYNADGIWFNGKWEDYVFEIGLGAATGAIGGGVGSFFSTSNFIAGLVLSTSLGTGSQIISDYYYGNLNSNSKWYDILFSGIKGGMVAGSSYVLSFGVTRFLASKEFARIVGTNTSNHHINQALGKAGLAGKIGQVGKSGIIRELMNSKSFDNFNTMFNWLLDTFFVGLSQ